jgi:hypothetical protein
VKTRKVLAEPLTHFFVLGLLLFALYAVVNDESGLAAEEIVVDQARVTSLVLGFEKTWQRPPTAAEQQGLIEAWVREEILYREGVAIGFDLDDPVIRRRVAQKMSFVADGVVPETPDDAELEAWLAANMSDYQIPAVYSLQQVYIDPQRHSDDLEAFVSSIAAGLANGADPKSLGDSTLLLAAVSSSSSLELARAFGTEFVNALADVTVGDWQGPIRSGYGLHIVKIDDYAGPRTPELEEVRAAVERDFLNDKSKQIGEAFYAALRERYTVRVESIAQND